MTTIELKSLLIKKINQIDDESFLEAIRTIIESKAEENIYQLNEIQKEKIKEAKYQIAKGEFIGHDDLMNEIDEWLEKR